MIRLDRLRFVHGASPVRGGTLVFFWFVDLEQGMVAVEQGAVVTTARLTRVQRPTVTAVA